MLHPLDQTVSRTTGEQKTTGEFPTHRRNTFEFPVDLPREKLQRSVRAEVEASLRHVCGNWPTGEFDRIVADVTSTAMKYHGRQKRRVGNATGERNVTYVRGFSAVITFATAAVHSVQKFLQLETLPPK